MDDGTWTPEDCQAGESGRSRPQAGRQDGSKPVDPNPRPTGGGVGVVCGGFGAGHRLDAAVFCSGCKLNEEGCKLLAACVADYAKLTDLDLR